MYTRFSSHQKNNPDLKKGSQIDSQNYYSQLAVLSKVNKRIILDQTME